MEKHDYSKDDIIKALVDVGISKNDNVFIHSNIGFFGKLQDATNKESYYEIFRGAILEVIRKNGTIVVPTFSYSFCWNQTYDKKISPSTTGMFPEMIMRDPKSFRSDDANFSVTAIGKNAEYFTKDAPSDSFGKNSFYERFLQNKGKICNFNFDAGSTFVHYVEKLIGVPYRFEKAFTGKSVVDGQLRDETYIHYARDLSNPKVYPDFSKMDKLAKKLGLAKTANLGRGQIVCISARDTLELIYQEIKKDPNFLITDS